MSTLFIVDVVCHPIKVRHISIVPAANIDFDKMTKLLTLLSLGALALATPTPQGRGAPAACSPDYNGEFQISIIQPVKRDIEVRS